MPKLDGAFYHNEIKVANNQFIAKPIIYLRAVYDGMYNPFDFK